ncbi:hypothetical protein Bcell_2382 [Evansella cellulosilytica DSM 2522]|uniref:Uncharacterized protein n=1 Tax=Evansella cellulosilytica (strain ATCC 21833 / DSM 2522 / FERM P-1141 / JCM 9156 / N-4) TaxID=649639 RepID=E6TRY6_EVAC2|nr:hypothetical protein Bcell_2382 [Evansella cellulosilytica DSM 2522]
MRSVKLLIFLTGLTLLAFLNSRYRDNFNEAYAFSKFMKPEQGMNEHDKMMDKDYVDINKGGSGDEFGGGE